MLKFALKAWSAKLFLDSTADLFRSQKRLQVLLFHEVKDLEKLKNLVNRLKAYGNFCDPANIGAFADHESQFIISFDDGYYSSGEACRMLDEQFGIKSLFFVSCDFVECADPESFIRNNFLRDSLSKEPPVTWKNLQNLFNDGHRIGSHTLGHRRLSSLSVDDLRSEIIESKETLGWRLGVDVKDFAFPFGNLHSFSARAQSEVLKHYDYCYSGIRGSNTNASLKSGHVWRQSIDLADPMEVNLYASLGGFDQRYTRIRNQFAELKHEVHLDA